MVIIGVLKEPEWDNRVSLTPEITNSFSKATIQVLIEQGAGERSFFSNKQYLASGAKIESREEVLKKANLLLSINRPSVEDMSLSPAGAIWLGVYQPLYFKKEMQEWAQKNHSIFSLDLLPRTTRAQSMDVLSSQSNISGYKAVLLAANTYSRYFPMFMTAAGSIPPVKVLILGAGVAGLQAIATAKRLGAVVEVFDTRTAVKEEVMSLGAKFVEVEGAAEANAGGYAIEQSEEFQKKQKEKIAQHVAKADIVITTAQIPGKKAPLLITSEMIHHMKAGSIIIDLAAATGGNTELTQNNNTVEHNGVTIIGNSLLNTTMPSDASKLYAKNIYNFLQLVINKENKIELNFEDDLVKESCIAHDGKILYERILS